MSYQTDSVLLLNLLLLLETLLILLQRHEFSTSIILITRVSNLSICLRSWTSPHVINLGFGTYGLVIVINNKAYV